jgi:hypothetical protein
VPAAIARYRQMRLRYPTEYFKESNVEYLVYQQINAITWKKQLRCSS